MTSRADRLVAVAASQQATCPQPGPLILPNLLNTFAELTSLVLGELRRDAPLNSYLLAAGINQIVEDYLHPDPFSLTRLPRHLTRLRRPVGPLAAITARWLARVVSHPPGYHLRTRRLRAWQAELAAFVQRLAEAVLCPETFAARHAELLAGGEALFVGLERFPQGLRREVIRIPSCFRSFDQRPADVDRIIRAFAQRWPDRGRLLVVVGVRTSGSYLAPLCAASLKAHGYSDVGVLTIRPGRQLLPAERAVLGSVVRGGGLALLTDDPPATGGSLVESADDLVLAGVPAEVIVLLLQLFGSDAELPPLLRRFAAVLLPWPDWTVHEQLRPAAIQRTLSEVLGRGVTIRNVERMPSPFQVAERGHVHAGYRIDAVDRATGRCRERRVFVKGAGVGYFGEHALAVARGLRRFAPEMYGVHEGLVYQAWLPDAQRLAEPTAGNEETVAQAVAAYVVARNRALAVDEDVSLRLGGRLPAWEAASNLLCRAFGRGWLLARPLVDPLVRRLLRPHRPSVIDGNMALGNWFTDEGDSDLLYKVNADERAFCHLDLTCFDPVYDLAGLAADCKSDLLPDRLRRAYEGLTGERIDDERWLLYQLVHLWDAQRLRCEEHPDSYRRSGRALQRYFGAIFFSDVAPSRTGALCAIDVDGVLETEHLGLAAVSPAGALALRALIRHGFRPVLVTGRSLDDVRERCHAYRLVGGVAEYGAVAYNHDTAHVQHLLSDADRADLYRLRAELRALEGVQLDPTYCHAVRAYRYDGRGRRRCLDAETVAKAFALSGMEHRVRAIVGDAQTDFMVATVDKGTGFRALAENLGWEASHAKTPPAAFAIGDTVADLPVFGLAARAFAPAQADARVRRAGVKVMRKPYQSGLALAAAHMVGHPPGGCPTCALPQLTRETRALLTVLAAQEAGPWGMVRSALILALQSIAWNGLRRQSIDRRARQQHEELKDLAG